MNDGRGPRAWVLRFQGDLTPGFFVSFQKRANWPLETKMDQSEKITENQVFPSD
jgi:hypothetical protein